ncbi:MAG: sulfatase-like hydrolase/transferase, partial [Actinobacteria bacterium]|nr:sulfatase-like hydrolase/transferase [Actinomycetota bacterium]
SCSASRSVLLTGVHNHRNGQYGHEHEYHHFSAFPNVRSLSVLLAEAGYRTARGGKFHVAPESVFRFQQVITLPTLEAFIKADSAKPFFVYYGTHEPHRPFNHDAEDRVDPRRVTVPPWLPDIPEVRDELALYEASVRKVDKAFGTLVDTLKRTGTYEDTLIVYLSDNGAPFPGSKTNVYEPGIRLPLIVKKPGQARRGIINTAMISWVDITPTILDFAGVPDRAAAALPAGRARALYQRDPGHPGPLVSRHRRAAAAGGMGRGLRIAHLSRDHDVLPHAGRPHPHAQADLEHRPSASVPVRQRPLRVKELAGGSCP